MTKETLFFKTAFCCVACDGEIAQEEISLLKDIANDTNYFGSLDIEEVANQFVDQINEQGGYFLTSYLSELSSENLPKEDQLLVVQIAIKSIEADKKIQYSEISFFKKIRNRLSVSDDEILSMYPDKPEMYDYLLPDIEDDELSEFSSTFQSITFNLPA